MVEVSFTRRVLLPPADASRCKPMKTRLRTTIAAIALFTAMPAHADIVQAAPSDDQGITVHNDGSASTGTTVLGELGQNSGVDVIFTGTTTDSSNLMLSSGQGQATVTGASNTATALPNDTFNITSFNIALEDDAFFNWIELSLAGTGSVSFSLLDDSGTTFTSDLTGAFTYALANGQNKFAFQAVNGQSIAGLSFTVANGGVETVKQVRISPAVGVVPEPATWAMMLLGFGAVGYSIRRRRKTLPAQIA